MPSTQVILIVSLVVAVEVLVILGLRMWVRSAFEGLAAKFPSRPPERDARRKSFQSIRVGMMNFGFSFDIALDARHAHFTPLRLGRLFGALPFSLPRELLSEAAKGLGGYRKIRTGLNSVLAPEWLFEVPEDPR